MASSSYVTPGGGDTGSGSERESAVASTTAPSTQWPGAGIFVKVEFGVSFSPTNSRNLTFGYASRNMEEQIFGGRNAFFRPRPRNNGPVPNHPPSLMPGNGNQDIELRNQERPRRRRIRSRSALQLRTSNSPVSPLSALSPEPAFYQRQPNHAHHHSYTSTDTQPQQFPSHQVYQSFTYPPAAAGPSNTTYQRAPIFPPIHQSTIDRKPLPPLPSRFRLGEDELPWTSPTVFNGSDSPFTPYAQPASISQNISRPPGSFSDTQTPPRVSQPAYHPSTSDTPQMDNPYSTYIPSNSNSNFTFEAYQNSNTIAVNTNNNRNEDPHRTRDLAVLQSAMMTIDSLNDSGWSPGDSGFNWDDGLPSGPRGLGWAVRVEDPREERERERLRLREIGRRDREGNWAVASGNGEGNRGRSNGQASFGDRTGETPISPPPPYNNNGVGQWGWEWEWEERFGYWVRADLRRSYSR